MDINANPLSCSLILNAISIWHFRFRKFPPLHPLLLVLLFVRNVLAHCRAFLHYNTHTKAQQTHKAHTHTHIYSPGRQKSRTHVI